MLQQRVHPESQKGLVKFGGIINIDNWADLGQNSQILERSYPKCDENMQKNRKNIVLKSKIFWNRSYDDDYQPFSDIFSSPNF